MTLPSALLESDYRDIVDSFSVFVRRELTPLAAEADHADGPSPALRSYARSRSAALGFYAGHYPVELGGSGMPFSAMVALHHAAGRSGCRLAPYALAGSDGPSPLLLHGNAKQRKEYLEPLIRGVKTRCLALTEPHGGSDAFHLTTTAIRDGDGWVLSGQKTFVSNVDHADFVLVVAAISTKKSCVNSATFICDKAAPGLKVGQQYEGMSGEMLSELIFDEVRVAADAIIGEPENYAEARESGIESLSQGRLIIAAQCNGMAEYALSLGLSYARQRHAFGRAIGAYQHIQEHLVASRAELEASKLLTLACARLADNGRGGPENAAMAKLTASTMAIRVIDRALQVHGASGWVKGHDLEYLYRQVRMMTIVEGTTEIQKVILAEAMGLG